MLNFDNVLLKKVLLLLLLKGIHRPLSMGGGGGGGWTPSLCWNGLKDDAAVLAPLLTGSMLCPKASGQKQLMGELAKKFNIVKPVIGAMQGE